MLACKHAKVCVEYLIFVLLNIKAIMLSLCILSERRTWLQSVFTAELSVLKQFMHGSVLALSSNPFIPSWSLCTVSVATTGRDVMVGGVRCFCSAHPSREQRVSEVCTGERLFLKNQHSDFRQRDGERNKSAYLYFKSCQQPAWMCRRLPVCMNWPK